MPTKQVRRLLSVAAMAPLLLTSCDSNNPFDPSRDAVGTYQLTVFAGRSVPATFTCNPGECTSLPNGGTFVATDGDLVLYADGRFVETNYYTETPTGGSSQNSTFVSTGTYDVNFDEVTLSAPAQNGIGARFLNATLTSVGGDIRINYIEDGESYEYRR